MAEIELVNFQSVLLQQITYSVVVVNNLLQDTGLPTSSRATNDNLLGLAHAKTDNNHHIARGGLTMLWSDQKKPLNESVIRIEVFVGK